MRGKPRRPVSASVHTERDPSGGGEQRVLTLVMDDGTVWLKDFYGWEQVYTPGEVEADARKNQSLSTMSV